MSTTIAGIYGGGPLYVGGLPLMDDLRASGLTTVIAWSVHVQPTGDLHLNDTQIVTDGSYVGHSAWPSQLGYLKASPTNVGRILMSVGAGGTSDFANIQALMKSGGAQPGGILYRNFQAIRSAFPAVDGVDFDDEDLQDEATTVGFAQMLALIGFDVTFCPYDNMPHWVKCLQALETSNPGLVRAFNLQCYSGGTGNDPEAWITAIQNAMGAGLDAKSMVLPGLWCANGSDCGEGQPPASVASTLAGWRDTGITGAWIWLLDDVLACQGPGSAMGTADYAAAIASALG